MTNPYWASNFDAFEQFGDALTQALQSATESKVEGLGFEGQIQLVFFHPQYVSVWKSKCYGASVLNRRVDVDAIDTAPARWRGDAGSSPLDHSGMFSAMEESVLACVEIDQCAGCT